MKIREIASNSESNSIGASIKNWNSNYCKEKRETANRTSSNEKVDCFKDGQFQHKNLLMVVLSKVAHEIQKYLNYYEINITAIISSACEF